MTTIAPSVIQIDTGELATVQTTLGIAHPTGYPLFTILGYIFSLLPLPFSKIFQLNLLAAIYCAIAVSIFTYTSKLILDNLSSFQFIKTVKVKSKKKKGSDKTQTQTINPVFELSETIKIIAAVFSGLFLALSRTFWFQSTSVEVYSLHLLLITLIILSLIKAFLLADNTKSISKYWIIFAITLALGFTNHMTTLLIIPVFIFVFFVLLRLLFYVLFFVRVRIADLAVEGEWLEAPFWIWSQANPRRKRLFVKRNGDELLLTDRQDINARLTLTEQGDAGRAVEQLAELARSGVKIRSRALVTTLWARLVLSDLFIHGIGGGNYDLVTDRIIERFFHRMPPGFMILSATLFLPINHSPRQTNLRSVPGEGQGEGGDMAADPATIDWQLRELTYHPERYIDGVFEQSQDKPAEVRSLVESKRQWIETPQTPENARTRCRAIRGVNESLQPYMENLRRQLHDDREKAAKQEQAKRILSWREYGFCLYPEETLRDFMDKMLPH